MRQTSNLGLALYDSEDKMNITSAENSLNHNMELIDEAMRGKLNVNQGAENNGKFLAINGSGNIILTEPKSGSSSGMTDEEKEMLYGKLTIASIAPATDGTYTYYLNPDTKVLYKLESSKWVEFTTIISKDFNVAEIITGAIYNAFADNDLELLTDKYCDINGAAPVATYSGAISAKVAVYPGMRIFYAIKGYLTKTNNFGRICFCDAEDNILYSTISLSYSNGYSYLDMLIPDGCSYAYFPIKLNSSYNFNNSYILGYITTDNEDATIFKNKTWLAMGDSLTERNLRAGKNYHDYVAEKTGIKVINAGVSGTGYKNGINSEINFASRILNYADTDFDVITVFGSGNDIGATLGTEKDSGTDTIGGLVNLFLDNLYSIKPFVKVGIISPCPWQNYTPDVDDNYMMRYSELLQKIAKRRGIPFLDLYYSSGLHPDKSDYRTEFYKDDGPGSTGSIDGVHPNSKGHEILSSHVLEFLKTLILPN